MGKRGVAVLPVALRRWAASAPLRSPEGCVRCRRLSSFPRLIFLSPCILFWSCGFTRVRLVCFMPVAFLFRFCSPRHFTKVSCYHNPSPWQGKSLQASLMADGGIQNWPGVTWNLTCMVSSVVTSSSASSSSDSQLALLLVASLVSFGQGSCASTLGLILLLNRS